jgi:U3 small nucleolar RNA-associated protein 21
MSVSFAARHTRHAANARQFFDFHSAALEHTLVLPSNAVALALHRDSGLLAVVCDDLLVRVVDVETHRVVRELGGFGGRILDVVRSVRSARRAVLTRAPQAFSPDARWLVASALDGAVRTFDVPSGRLLDAFRAPSAAVSVAFSPTADFLATAHVDSVGIFLWCAAAPWY